MVSDLVLAQELASRLTTYGAPTGYALRRVYAVPPDAIQAVPALVVFASSDSISYGAANRQVGVSFVVRCYLHAQADSTRRFQDLLTWRGHLRDALIGDVTLGGYVAQASVTSTSIGDATYNDVDYLVVEVSVDLQIVEAISAQA
jgi:hypothetical protein